jgi:hypothetical protein
MRCTFLFVAVVVASLGSGCGKVGCDFRGGSVNGPEDRCQEREGISATMFMLGCAAAGGEQVEGGCPEEGRVFGCNLGLQGDLTTVTDWHYEPLTAEDAVDTCDSEDAIIDV